VSGREFTGCGKLVTDNTKWQGTTLLLAEKSARRESFVSGHDFSRAEKAAKIAGL
jgi:hypothetical protein